MIAGFSSVPARVANLGSGGKTFDIPAGVHIHIDLVHGRLLNKVGVIANVEHLPLKDSSADLVVCLGSVINHGNGKAMISEIGRILRPGALLALEFDCSDGLHHTQYPHQQDPVLINTFFNGQMLTLLEYSRTYVEQELALNGLTIEHRHSFHILSSLLLRFRIPPSIAAAFIYFDRIARLSPRLRYRGSNMFLTARRN
jgi:SAM-dependent methyltransferase